MPSKITITYEDGTTSIAKLRLTMLARVMRESSMHKKRSVKPILPWLIDYAFETAEKNESNIKRIDVEERAKL